MGGRAGKFRLLFGTAPGLPSLLGVIGVRSTASPVGIGLKGDDLGGRVSCSIGLLFDSVGVTERQDRDLHLNCACHTGTLTVKCDCSTRANIEGCHTSGMGNG